MGYYRRPPDRNKYSFSKLEVGQQKEINGDYRLIRIASNSYCKGKEIKIVVVKQQDNVLIKRIK